MKSEHWAYIGIGLTCLYFLATCDGCGGDNNTEYSSTIVDDSYSWLQGTWICNTPYGTIRIEIDGDHISEDYGDGDIMYGTYRISNGVLYPNTNSHVSYPLDMSARKIGDGRGGYFRKQ